MNIIHIINALEIGGAERLLVETLPEIKQMRHDVKVILLYSSNSYFEKQLKQSGIEVIALNHKHEAYNICLIAKLHQLIKDADVVHSHLFPSQYWAALAHCGIKKGILVTTEHNTSNTIADYLHYNITILFRYDELDYKVTYDPSFFLQLIFFFRLHQ